MTTRKDNGEADPREGHLSAQRYADPCEKTICSGGEGSTIATWQHCQLELFMVIKGDDLVFVDCTQENI